MLWRLSQEWWSEIPKGGFTLTSRLHDYLPFETLFIFLFFQMVFNFVFTMHPNTYFIVTKKRWLRRLRA